MTTKRNALSGTTHTPASKPAANKRETARSRRASMAPAVDSDALRAMIAQAAYFRAKKRGFAGGSELNDWLDAEREIARMLDN